VLKACEDRYVKEIEKMTTLPKDIYGDEYRSLDVSPETVSKWFKTRH
jgi:hypothetical protein